MRYAYSMAVHGVPGVPYSEMSVYILSCFMAFGGDLPSDMLVCRKAEGEKTAAGACKMFGSGVGSGIKAEI